MTTNEPKLSLSVADRVKRSGNVDTSTHTFEEIVTFLSEDGHIELDEKKMAPTYNFSCYQGKQRKQEFVVNVSAATLDLDELPADKLPQIREAIGHFKSLCHTTFSHTAVKPKLRIIVPFRTPVDATRYRDYVRRLAKMLDVEYDRASENPNTLYFVPSRPRGTTEDHFIESHPQADFLDFETLPPAGPRSAKTTSAGQDTDERNYYDLAAEAQGCLYGDGLVFVNGEFYAYNDGVWSEVPIMAMKKVFSRKESPLHDALASPAAMNNLIEGLKAHAHLNAFPDASPMTVCVSNGVVDLDTGELREHDARDWHRNHLEIEYQENAECPRWRKFLAEVFAPDQDQAEKIAFLQEFAGYLLVPSSEHQTMLLCVGEGANGKSVTVEIMQALLGTSNYCTVPLHQLGQAFRNAVLQGKLANFCGEISNNRRVDERAIKQIVGGDPIYAEKKGKDGFSFKPYSRIVATGNTLPEVDDTSDGFSRRLAILAFNRRFAEHEREHDLLAKLLEELPGIFVWALEGLRRVRDSGKFTRVPSSAEAVAAYKLRINPVAQFMTTVAEKSTGRERTKSSDLYKEFQHFCHENGFLPVMTNSRFGSELARMDIKSKKSNGNLYYPVKLRAVDAPTRPSKPVSLVEELGLDAEEAA
ncbi:phage/plasmid primase, P4 family [Paraburkholderia sp. RL17-380-BIE-A]|uniref:DNA primase family protein n=1 Tax=Paraburkholderia sp. RL17-380-BIE-A TaxID=3031630 RepID=UPI0038BC9CB4